MFVVFFTGLFFVFLFGLNYYIMQDGSFIFYLPVVQKVTFVIVLLWILFINRKLYMLKAKKEGYFTTSEVLDLSKDKRFRAIRRTLLLVKIEPGQKITMREVLFQQSQYELEPGASSERDQVVAMLDKYPTMELLVEGHTDNQGEWDLNMKLSEDRVRVVKEYLMAKGIGDNRIQTKAWGPSKPVASNTNEEKRKLNRRVEFTILKL